MRILTLILLAVVWTSSYSQWIKNYVSVGFGTSYSFTDVPSSLGVGIHGAWMRKSKSNFGTGFEINLDRFTGGKSTKGSYEFTSNAVTVLPTLDYSFVSTKAKYEFRPSIGLGFIYASAEGGFESKDNNISWYNEWGEPHFYPINDANGNLVDAMSEQKSFMLAAMPALSIAYYPTRDYKLFMRVGYLMMLGDELDAHNYPVLANKDNDVVVTTHVGVSFLVFKNSGNKLW